MNREMENTLRGIRMIANLVKRETRRGQHGEKDKEGKEKTQGRICRKG